MKDIMDELKGQNRILLRGARCSGKTTAAIEWAMSRKEDVAFVSLTREHSLAVYKMAYRECLRNIHTVQNGNQINFSSGGSILFLSVDDCRGRTADAVVLDNVDTMKDMDVCYAMAMAMKKRADESPTVSFFATHTLKKSSGISRILKMDNVEPIFYKSYDYLDMMADGLLTPQSVRYLHETLSKNAFSSQFGPFERELPRKGLTNKLLKHLLKEEA